MAHVVKISQGKMLNKDRKQHFYRTLLLNTDIGSNEMRGLIEHYLKLKGVTLQQHLTEPNIKLKLENYKQLSPEQIFTLNSSQPSLDKMDVSLLTVILLQSFPKQLSGEARTCISALKRIRNNLAHAVKAELDDDSMFNHTSQEILKLAQEATACRRYMYMQDLHQAINDIRHQEVVYNHCNLDRVKLNNEVYVIKMVEATDNERVEEGRGLSIKIGLTKWTRQLTRGLSVEIFLQALKEDEVISDTTKQQIEKEYYYDDQMQVLILHMMNETKLNLYRFCQCLRKLYPTMAYLIENSNTDGREVEEYLKSFEKETITRLLREHLVENEDKSVTTESVHIFIEERYGFSIAFNSLKGYVHDSFPEVNYTEQDWSFFGLCWKESMIVDSRDDNKEPLTKPRISDMTIDEFSNLVGDRFENDKLATALQTAIVEESITPNIFAAMTDDDMRIVFPAHIEQAEKNSVGKLKYGFGVQKTLQNIRHEIECEIVPVESKITETLREFDTSFNRTNYCCGHVRPNTGHLLVPAHEFRCHSSSIKSLKHFIVKRAVYFIAACINGRKNGTIHFGIEPLGNNVGQIRGLRSENWHFNLNFEIGRAIDSCFHRNAYVAFKCVRPVHIIPVEGGGNVIEVDVVPMSIFLLNDLLWISFPPKGNQRNKCCVYSLKPDGGIQTISHSSIQKLEGFYSTLLKQRQQLEQFNDKHVERSVLQVQQLRKMLTGGEKFVTDAFVPIIISGKATANPKELEIRAHLADMSGAFTSSLLVLDCDSSVYLRKRIEGDTRVFNVKMAEDFVTNSELSRTASTWLYVNGNEELSKEDTTIEDWIDNRADGIRKAFERVKELIPKSRAKVIFLIHQSSALDKGILKEIARMTFLTNFKNQCLVIAEKDEDVLDLKNELTSLIGSQRLENCFHTGSSWKNVARVMKNVFKLNMSIVCKVPHCDGHYVEMTGVERDELNFTDIEILSGEECIDREAIMTEKKKKSKARMSQVDFYRGSTVSWWNFYYQQVGVRDLYTNHREEIKEKLENDNGNPFPKVHEIQHHPGAGGTTLGRHLLWYFSQFRKMPENTYRCCIVKSSKVTDETIEQIERFRNFKDGAFPKPFIVLADNMNEECEQYLKTKLHELAYKTANPGRLFCLIMFIIRKPVTYDEADPKLLLTHSLSGKEQVWFEEKYRQMENEDVDVETLLAFNFMRKSFQPDFMQQTTDRLMECVSKTEMGVLRCLALINSYGSDCHVPESVFDSMMETPFVAPTLPWGIAHTVKELQRMARLRCEQWNSQISRAMNLLIVKRQGPDFYSSGICLVSQLLARCVLKYIRTNENVSLENIVENVLDLVGKKMSERDPMSRRFVKIVSSLFKTRQMLEGDGIEMKQKFSDLVLDLQKPSAGESDMIANGRVLRTTGHCFEVTKDPLVGQQLARFNIHIQDFAAAEVAIEESLEIQKQNSYLLHTYGQIYKSKMESILNDRSQNKRKLTDAEAADIIELAEKAIQKYVKGQEISISLGENTAWGCFNTEVRTALTLLEKFQSFGCYTNKNDFIRFLNEDIKKVADGPLLRMMRRCQTLGQFRAGSGLQYHLETSLRSLEERSYQVKRKLYVIYSEDETLLLGLRERFERFYGSLRSTSKFQFTFGIGLKPLMDAKERSMSLLTRRIKEATDNLESGLRTSLDVRDLLVYIGNQIIDISRRGVGRDTDVCSLGEYKRLLSYSNRLVALETAEPLSKRRYLETFLYYAMLHWPLKSRTVLECEALAEPATYEDIVKKWQEAYNRNYFIKSMEQQKRYKPKNFFALGKGSPGNDIVDLKLIEREWMERQKRTTGRVRRHVLKDFFWREDFVEERLQRLEGTIDGSGNTVTHEVEYPGGYHKFRIRTYYPCPELGNRCVTFVLGFTWKEPTAFDVVEADKGKRFKEDKARSSEENVEKEINRATADMTEIIYERTSQCDGQSATVDRPKPRRRRKRKQEKIER